MFEIDRENITFDRIKNVRTISEQHRYQNNKEAEAFLKGLVILVLFIFYTGRSALGVNDYESVDTLTVNINHDDIVVFRSEMEFYWNQLITPADFNNLNDNHTGHNIMFPETWNDLQIEGERLKGRGNATYRTTFDVDTIVPLAFQIKDYCNAYKLWVNGELISQEGFPGTNREITVPAKVNAIAEFIPRQGSNEFVLQTANYQEFYGGFRKSFLLGEAEKIKQEAVKKQTIDAFILGFILLVLIYNFIIYGLDRSRKSFLWFGMMVFFIFLRQLFLSDIGFLDQWIQNNISLYLKITIASATLTSLMLVFLFCSVFSKMMNQTLRKYYTGGIIIFTVFIFSAPIYYVSAGVHYFQVVVISIILYILFLTIKSFWSEYKGQWLIAVGILLFILTVFLEFLIFNRLMYKDYLLHYGLLPFILLQSIALSNDLAKTNIRNQRLIKALESHKKNLQKEIENKTREIIDTKERELFSVSLQKDSKERLLQEIHDRLKVLISKDVEDEGVVNDLVRLVQVSINENGTDRYLMHFQKIHPGFMESIKKKFSRLTQNEIKLCVYLKLDLNNKEIADFLHIEPESVRRAKTRMRQKMGLANNNELMDYINKL